MFLTITIILAIVSSIFTVYGLCEDDEFIIFIGYASGIIGFGMAAKASSIFMFHTETPTCLLFYIFTIFSVLFLVSIIGRVRDL